MSGIPDDIRESHRVMNENDDEWLALTEWEIRKYEERPRPFRRRYVMDEAMDDEYVAGLVQHLRALADEVQEHGLTLRADLHGLGEGSAFDGLAACADTVQELRTASGRAFRCAKWDTGRGEVALYGGEAA